MKKFAFVIFSAVLAMGCVPTEPTPDPARLELSEDSINFNCLGQEISIELTHKYAWTHSIPDDVAGWLSLEAEASTGGIAPITLTATANSSGEGRTGSVTFTSEGLTRTLVVTQDALSGEVSSNELDLGYSGGTDYLVFSTTVPDWEISVTSEGEWIEAVKEGSDLIAVTSEFNDTGAQRIATITVTAGTLVREVTVTQDFIVFELSESSLFFGSSGGEQSVRVETGVTDWSWNIPSDVDWLACRKSGDGLIVSSTENTRESEGRTATITVGVEGFSREIVVIQSASGSYTDRQIVRLQEATVGSGVNIIIMGDGYVASDMSLGGGLYERDMKAAMEHFFSVYPYSAYRDYFNVWMVGAVSNESGMSVIYPRKNVDTVFASVWDGGNSTGIDCNANTVMDYARPIANLVDKSLAEIMVIMPINKNVYAGTCSMYLTGFSIAMCPVGPTYREIVVHEAGGHGFGKLLDEYIYEYSPYPTEKKISTRQWQQRGQFLNIDFSADITNTLWSGFAGNADYPMVGTWEGADLYQYGVWRCEFNSCMNDNVLYFNAQSRYSQMDKIHKLAGEEYSFEQFLEEDIIPPYPAAAKAPGRGVLAPFVPLAPPRLNTDPVL